MENLKKYIITEFAGMAFNSSTKSNRLILVTSTGIIIGDPAFDEETDSAISSLVNVSKDIANEYREENNLPDSPLDGNDGFICLKNVTIKSPNTTTNIPFLNVFFDQIIGISLGDMD